MNRLLSYTVVPPLRVRRITPAYPVARPAPIGKAFVLALSAVSVWALVASQVALAMLIVGAL